jgi:serine/threonine-protein kinase
VNVGQQFGAYEVVGLLGRGGMATVFKAYQPSLDRHVALKVLSPELAHDDAFLVRFKGEARLIARVEHPNIVPIYDYGQVGDRAFIAMRFVPGVSLAQLIQQTGRLPFDRALRILAQVADALDRAHRLGVVHRDLKPANILVESGDRVSLADFGIARAVAAATRLTQVGTIGGTPEYMAPEQAKGGTVDHRADLYALGIVCFELLTGSTPFHADSGVAVLHQQIYAAPPELRSLRPDIPQHVVAAVTRMLAKQPDQRFPSAAAFVDALHGRLPSQGPAVLPPAGQRPAVGLAAARPAAGPGQPATRGAKRRLGVAV